MELARELLNYRKNGKVIIVNSVLENIDVLTEEELKEKIRADSVRFLTREEFSRALGIRACRACFGCGEETRKDEENGRTV